MSKGLFVQIWGSPDTAGVFSSEMCCVCPDCQRLTAPIHFWSDGEDFDSDLALAELGMVHYKNVLREQDVNDPASNEA